MLRKLFKELSVTLLLGIAIGLVVGIFEFLAPYIIRLAKYFAGSKNIWLNIIGIIISIGLGFLSYFSVIKYPETSGGGLFTLKSRIDNKDKNSNAFLSTCMIFIKSFFSFFGGLALGAEAPSVTMASYQADIVHKVFKDDKKDDIAIAAGAGFGCAFLSPISGIAFTFEMFLHRFSLKWFFRALAISAVSILICYTFYRQSALSFLSLEIFTAKQYYLLIIIILASIFFCSIFKYLMKAIEKIIERYSDKFLVKYRVIFTFAAFSILTVFFYNLTGSGINILVNENSLVIYILLIYFFIRMILTALSLNSTATGGSVVPIMVLGALVGKIVFSLTSEYMNIPADYEGDIMLISALTFFAVYTETIFTSSFFIITEAFKTFNMTIFASFIIPAFLTVSVSVVLYSILNEKITYRFRLARNRKSLLTRL